MEKLPLTEISPSCSYTSCASSRANTGHGYLYDDNAQKLPEANAIAARYSIMNPKNQPTRLSKIYSPLYIVVLLALAVFIIQLGASLSDVPSTRLLEGLICNKYYGRSDGGILPEDQCTVSSVQAELNVITMGALIVGYLPGKSEVKARATR